MGCSLKGTPIFQLSFLNNSGYLPVAGTLSGTLKGCLGIIHSIVHLAAVIFDFKNAKYHIYQVSVGVMSGILRRSLWE